MINKMKTLVFDIETSPMIAYVFGRHDQNIGLNQIKNEWQVLAWSAKWLDDPVSKIKYMDKRNDEDDERILKVLWRLLDEADVVITQNGKNFDSPKLNARFIELGMQPPSPYRHIDTYQIARRVAKFTSNKLEYLTDKLNVKYKKLSHSKFPGMELWKECMAGNRKAWDEMKKYNINDVLSTEELYYKLRAWAPPSMSSTWYVKDEDNQCEVCGGFMMGNGSRMTRKGPMMRYRCMKCGSGVSRRIK